MSENQQNTPQGSGGERSFKIQKIYTKDLSFETPNSPNIFTWGQQWAPETNVQISTKGVKLDQGVHEVTLTLTVTATLAEKTAYLAEVQQAGIFNIEGVNKEELPPIIGVYCPTILFPYAREVVSDLVIRGGFPQLALNPVNFEAIYAQHVKQQQDSEQGDQATTH